MRLKPPFPRDNRRLLLNAGALAAVALMALAGTTPAGERLPLERPHADHPGRPPYDGNPPPAVALPRLPWESKNRIVYAFDGPARAQLERSAELSAACRRGEFIQRIDMLYRAFGPDERPLGVAFGWMAVNLVDKGRRREATRVYFFERQDTGRCTVYSAALESLRPWFVGP